MKVVFLSNYFTHHQQPFSDAMYERLGDGYTFISTTQMSEERIRSGWGISEYPSYVVSETELSQERKKYQQMIDSADVVITGSAPHRFVKSRMEQGKLIFHYAERPLKKSDALTYFLPRLIKWRSKIKNSKPVYLLCASAYSASDFRKFGLFKNKCYRWGYFPECFRYEDVDELIDRKQPNSVCWCARLIDWKHPELVIDTAKRLKEDGYDFSVQLIGTGAMEQEISDMIVENGLGDYVTLLGTTTPDKVREYMENSQIYLFTSDRQEGWGAVLNESMNSACAVVASGAAGATNFLVRDKENGLVFESGNGDDLYEKVKFLLDNPEKRKEFSKNAYLTISDKWNAQEAAERFIELSGAILRENRAVCLYDEGICSNITS